MPRPKPVDFHTVYQGVSNGVAVFSTPHDKLKNIPCVEMSSGTYLMVGPQNRAGWKVERGDTITLHAEGGLGITSTCGKFWAFENQWEGNPQ